MTPRHLNGEHIGQRFTIPIANGAEPVTGTLDRVRHAEGGTYIEFAEPSLIGVYQTDVNGTVEEA